MGCLCGHTIALSKWGHNYKTTTGQLGIAKDLSQCHLLKVVFKFGRYPKGQRRNEEKCGCQFAFKPKIF